MEPVEETHNPEPISRFERHSAGEIDNMSQEGMVLAIRYMAIEHDRTVLSSPIQQTLTTPWPRYYNTAPGQLLSPETPPAAFNQQSKYPGIGSNHNPESGHFKAPGAPRPTNYLRLEPCSPSSLGVVTPPIQTSDPTYCQDAPDQNVKRNLYDSGAYPPGPASPLNQRPTGFGAPSMHASNHQHSPTSAQTTGHSTWAPYFSPESLSSGHDQILYQVGSDPMSPSNLSGQPLSIEPAYQVVKQTHAFATQINGSISNTK